jgi:predicted regulator of Ras-like GTPase activity (Roadblock/LC7/MglB family)
MERSFVGVVAGLPGVAALVITDPRGALLESRGALDAEAIGAAHAAMLQSLARCGHCLGLGTLHRVTITGSNYGCVIALDDQKVIGVYVDPGQPLGAFEHELETALGR